MKLKTILLFVVFSLVGFFSMQANASYYLKPKQGSTNSIFGSSGSSNALGSSGSLYDNTHSVKPYYKKDGTYVPQHRAGNPNSGVHCRNNFCY